MDIKQIKILTVFLFILPLCPLLLPISIHAASRDIAVISDLSHESGKLGVFKALIIGINDYKDPNIPDLETAGNDAKAMAKLLRELYGFKVELLLDRKATREGIYRALRNLTSSSKPDESVLIYYAGHGDLDQTYDDGWWIPVDAKAGSPVTYLDNGQVQKAMRSMKARHVLLISDSCYSGTLFGQERAMPQVIDDKYYLNLYNEKSRWGMTSGNKTPVSDAGTGGHSVFAYQLIKELRKNDKRYISTLEIYTRIASVVGNNSEQMPLCRPIRNTGDQGGEFVFVASRGAAVKKPAQKSSVDTTLDAEHKRLELERMDLERLKIEIEREKLDAELKRIKAEKKKQLEFAKEEAKKYISASPEVSDDLLSSDLKINKQEQLTAVHVPEKSISINDRIDSSRNFPYKLMIFPWLASTSAHFHTILDRIIGHLQKSGLFTLKFSFYKIHENLGAKKIDNIINDSVIDKIWSKKSFFSRKEPNMDLICKLGEALKVDTVLTGKFDVVGSGGYRAGVRVYLIDIKTKTLSSVSTLNVPLYGGQYIEKVDSLSKTICNNYKSQASPN